MTKLDWERRPYRYELNSEYWLNPKTGFDREWHEQKNKLNKNLGIHKEHEWQPVKLDSGPHAGKAICKTCGNKFICWLPKNYFNT